MNTRSGRRSLSLSKGPSVAWQYFGNLGTKNLLINGGRNGVKIALDEV